VLGWVFGILTGIPLLGLIFTLAVRLTGLLSFASMVYLAIMAYKNNMFKIPVIGEVVWNQINK